MESKIELYYIDTNAYHMVMYRNDALERYECYTCDGSEDFPIIDDKVTAASYLERISEDHENLGGADSEMTIEEFNDYIASTNDTILAKLIITEEI